MLQNCKEMNPFGLNSGVVIFICGSINYIYEAAQCKTLEESLVNKIMGQRSFYTSHAMEKGKKLEKDVGKAVANETQISVQELGLLSKIRISSAGCFSRWCVTGFCVEVKCPSTESSMEGYVKDAVTAKKVWAQLQAGMYLTKKTRGLVHIFNVDYDPEFEIVLDKAIEF